MLIKLFFDKILKIYCFKYESLKEIKVIGFLKLYKDVVRKKELKINR